MAVEIPVVVDIEGAFQDAARRVKSAIAPLERTLTREALDIRVKVGLDEEGEPINRKFGTIVKNFKAGKDVSDEFNIAIQELSVRLAQAAEAGNKADFTKFLEAKTYAEDAVVATTRIRLEMDGLAGTIKGLNSQLSSANIALNSFKIDSPEWKAAAKEIRRVTAEMDKVQRKMAEMGTKAGSIDRINMKIRELTEKWNAMSRAQKFDKDGNLRASAQKVVEKYKQLTAEAERFGKSLEATAMGAKTKTRQLHREISGVNAELERSNSRLMTLLKNSLRLLAIHSASRFVRNIREVTAEFELQKVALGSIIQDTEKAEGLFKQIKKAAVESPFEIKDLVTYTKQLSAYQIETDKLFDTTMKLADISSGLGVDMGRLILAFGQVRAAAVLRGQELRQFTEAGIPLVDKLAQKFSDLNGRAVTTAEVFELISKRAVPFSMIEEIFSDLTSAGGAFYKMQEKQAETLLGQWNNLKDSVSIMYDEIGNTAVVHGAMEAMISDAKTLMQNWRQIASTIKYAGIGFLTVKTASLFIPNLVRNTQLLEKAEVALARAKRLSNIAQVNGNKIIAMSASAYRAYAYYTILAARATTQWGRAINNVRAFLAGNWPKLVLAVLGLIVSRIISARQETARLNKELAQIGSEGGIRAEQSARNFERLAKTAVQAADGSREQKEAVDELVRTYGDLLPSSDKVVDKLKEMKGNYNELTEAIRQKINMQIQEQQIDTITSEYSKKIGDKQRKLKQYLKDQGLSTEEISAVTSQLQKAVKDGLIKVTDSVEEQAQAIEKIIYDYTGKYVTLFKEQESYLVPGAVTGEKVATRLSHTFMGLVKDYSAMNEQIDDVKASMEGSTGVMGKYADEWKKLQEEIGKYGGEGATKFAQDESRIRNRIEKSIAFLQEKFDEAKIDISTAIVNGTPDFGILDKLVGDIKDSSAQVSLRGIIRDFKKEFDKLELDDNVTNAIKSRLMEISSATGISMDKFTSYIKKAGEDSTKYLQELQEAIANYKKDANDLANLMQEYSPARTEDNEKAVKEYNGMAGALQLLFDWLSKIITLPAKTGGRGAGDDRLQNVRQGISDVTDAYKKYLELINYMDKQQALQKIDILFPSLAGWEPTYENMIAKLNNMLTAYKGDANATRLIQQAIANIEVDKIKSDMDAVLKQLSEKMKRSATARNFFNDIFAATGDSHFAESVTVGIYGDPGAEIGDRIKTNIEQTLKNLGYSTTEGLGKEILDAADKMDFREIMAKINEIPENLQAAVKEAAGIIESEDAELVKSFSSMISKYGSAANKIAVIRAKAQKETDDIRKALDLSLRDPNLSSEEKESIKKMAEEMIKALNAQADLDEFKASDDYVKFFSEINVMTAEQASLVRTKLREAYLKAFHDGAISADELRRNLRSIDQQFKKLNESASILQSYLTSGFDGAIEKVQEYSDTIMTLASKMKSGKELDEGEQAFASRMLKMFGSGETKGIESYTELINKFQTSGGLTKAGEAFGEMGEGMAAMAANGPGALAIVDAIIKAVNSTIVGIEQIINQLNEVRSEEKKIGEWYRYISDFNKYAFSGWEKLKSGDAIGAVFDTISSLISIYVNISKSITKRYDDQIKAQEKLINDLERSYRRLNDAIQDAFGSEYIAMYQQQLKALEAEVAAYTAQAEAERKKGKSGDEETAKGYEDSAYEAAQKIKDLHEEFNNFFLGSDITSAARSFATAWLDAYKSFGSTTAAMQEKFREMIDNMVVNSLAAKMVEDALQPVFNEMNKWADTEGKISEEGIASIANVAAGQIDVINQSLSGVMEKLAGLDINMRGTGSTLTGISKDIAGASEESILGLAAGINTQNYYMSYMPTISQNVAAIVALLGGENVASQPGTTLPGTSTFGDELFRGQMSRIDENLAILVDLVRSVRSVKQSSTNTHVIAVTN